MFTQESQQMTLDLASFVQKVKEQVIKQTKKRPPFHLFNFQYMYVNDYSVLEATALIMADLDKLKSA